MLEKPPCTVGQIHEYGPLVERILQWPCCCNFQYRFHPEIGRVEGWPQLRFRARDNLVQRYGRSVGEVMAAHPLDTAIRILGKPLRARLYSDGVRLAGGIQHERGESFHDYAIDAAERQSSVACGGESVELYRDDAMYSHCLSAWLTWAEGGERDPRLATLSDGLEVVKILEQVMEM